MCDGAKVHFGMVLKLHKIKMCSVEEFSGIFFFCLFVFLLLWELGCGLICPLGPASL